MEPNNAQQNPLSKPELPPPPTPALISEHKDDKHGSVGALIGIIIILVMLLVGALYIWGGQLREQASDEVSAPTELVPKTE